MIYYYKSYRWINGKLRKIITDEKNNIIENPTKEQIVCAKFDNSVNVRKTYTNKELLNFLIIFYEKNGTIPKQNDFLNNPEYPGSTIYYRRFGGWNNALTLARLHRRKRDKQYTDKELLNFLIVFCDENGRIPVQRDFVSNPEYPQIGTYAKRFGSWSNALKLVELDVDSMVKKGTVETDCQKARLAEIIVRDHFKISPIDLAGKNKNSLCDGICPNGMSYDVKSSSLHRDSFYDFHTNNKYKEEIEIYYFLAFNSDWTKLEHGWRVPGEIVENDRFIVGSTDNYEYNVDNMGKYDTTGKLKDVFETMKTNMLKK